MTKAPFAMTNAVIDQLAGALGIDPGKTRRVIIDLKVGEVVQVYTEGYGTTELVELLTPVVAHAVVFKTGETKEQ